MSLSPCINFCKLNAAGSLCTGCFRTLHEIACWSGMNDTEKHRILNALPGRKKSICSIHEVRRPESVSDSNTFLPHPDSPTGPL